MAEVDTVALNYTLADGPYRLKVKTDWTAIPERWIYITVGDDTGISHVEADGRRETVCDLQGRRLEGTLQRKGVYIRQGKKIINR